MVAITLASARRTVQDPNVFLRRSLLVVCIAAAPATGCMSNDGAKDPGASSPDSGVTPQEAGTDGLPTPGPGPLRIVSWNTWNFFDTIKGNCQDCPYEQTLSASEYQSKVAGVADGLAQLDGDVVVLQEVENDAVIDDIASSAALAGHGYTVHQLLRGNDPRGVNIGVMSRYPIDAYISHKGDIFTRLDAPATVYHYTRDVAEIHMTWGSNHVVILGVHFKSKASPDDPDRRVAEAQHTRQIADAILAQDPSARLFIVGDFNDTPGTDTYAAVRDGQSGPTWENAMAAVPSADRWSYEYNSQKQLIDQLFASPTVAGTLDPTSAKILHDSSLASDHAPIAATFVIP